MALTNKYVSSSASGGGDGSSGSPWTLAEAAANAPGGTRVNIRDDGPYTLSANFVPPGNGSKTSPIEWLGVASDDSDAWNGRAANAGAIDTTDFPVIDLNGYYFSIMDYEHARHIKFTGAGDATQAIRARNSQSASITRCVLDVTTSGIGIYAEQGPMEIEDCDLENTGGKVLSLDGTAGAHRVVGCKIKANTEGILVRGLAEVSHCLIYECGAYGVRIYNDTASQLKLTNCTIVGNASDGIYIENRNYDECPLDISYCMITDNGGYGINNAASGSWSYVRSFRNRFRDNTSGNTNGLIDGFEIDSITTDTGGQETDYVDAANDDYRLISGAAGEGSGAWGYNNIGAFGPGGSTEGGGRRPRIVPIGV